ncbi:hypothetical protein T458_10225 [Brevibacillus panacihumi W25]|uniref:Uncharacterized protein n=1 Tax=Brevibacillus panacihumi W25 TaxID=1408254 RepID=V6MHI4_9BACL|nr:hypothetical protein [Brevibacillus panacihumi]EST54883.1 hypothetical protein T458_10225 [Brevibacillus panacihumi W25]
MYWETLPNWFWIMYYLFLLATIGTAFYCFVQHTLRGLSIIAIVLSVIIPITGIINSIGRLEGLNEFEHFVVQLQQGFIWPILTMLGYLYLLVWWMFFLKHTAKNQKA